ncbi:MAG: hypothetical protein KDK89_16430 [Alphaproteobacteria bacterium]|nr:hypothetical protein [Alphaproteobacteria bacterium]
MIRLKPYIILVGMGLVETTTSPVSAATSQDPATALWGSGAAWSQVAQSGDPLKDSYGGSGGESGDYVLPERSGGSTEDPFKKSFQSGGSDDNQPDDEDGGTSGESGGYDSVGGSSTSGGGSYQGGGGSSSSSGGSGSTPLPGTTEVEAGTASNSEGSTRVIYTKDANGRTIGGTYIHYDENGKEIGREPFKVDPDSPDGESGNVSPPSADVEPEGATSDEEAGYVKNKQGTTKLIYTKDSKGRIVSKTYIYLDADGNETGRETQKIKVGEEVPPVDDETPPEDEADLPEGTFTGGIHGDAAGDIQFMVNGRSISGSVSGVYKNTPFTVEFRGTLDDEGKFRASAGGSAFYTIDNEEKSYPVSGMIEGQVTGIRASGTWWADKDLLKDADGTWSARQ